MNWFYASKRMAGRGALKELAEEEKVREQLFELRNIPVDRPRLCGREGALFGHPAGFPSLLVIGTDRDLGKASTGG